MSKFLSISVVTYNGNNDFDVILRDPDTGREVTLSGEQILDQEEQEFLFEVAAPCVFTRYQRVTPE